MGGAQTNGARLLPGSNPNGACASDKSKGIVSDDVRRSIHFQSNCIAGKGTDGAVLIGDGENDTGGVCTVSNERKIIGDDGELLVDTFA